jgi:hypothetical protein
MFLLEGMELWAAAYLAGELARCLAHQQAQWSDRYGSEGGWAFGWVDNSQFANVPYKFRPNRDCTVRQGGPDITIDNQAGDPSIVAWIRTAIRTTHADCVGHRA